MHLCDAGTEKSELEGQIMLLHKQSKTLDRLSNNDFDVDETIKDNEKSMRQTMIKLFAVSVCVGFVHLK